MSKRPLEIGILRQPKLQRLKNGASMLLYLALITSCDCNNIGIIPYSAEDWEYETRLNNEQLAAVLAELEENKLIMKDGYYILCPDFIKWAQAQGKHTTTQDNMIIEKLRLYANAPNSFKTALLEKYPDIFSRTLEQAEADRANHKRQKLNAELKQKAIAKNSTNEEYAGQKVIESWGSSLKGLKGA